MPRANTADQLEKALRAKCRASLEAAERLSQGTTSHVDAGISRAFYAVLQGLAVAFMQRGGLLLSELLDRGILRGEGHEIGFSHHELAVRAIDVLKDPKLLKLFNSLRGQRTSADYQSVTFRPGDLKDVLQDAEKLLREMEVLPCS